MVAYSDQPAIAMATVTYCIYSNWGWMGQLVHVMYLYIVTFYQLVDWFDCINRHHVFITSVVVNEFVSYSDPCIPNLTLPLPFYRAECFLLYSTLHIYIARSRCMFRWSTVPHPANWLRLLRMLCTALNELICTTKCVHCMCKLLHA